MTHGAIVAVGVLPDPLAAELDARGGCRVPVSLDVPENLDRDAVRVVLGETHAAQIDAARARAVGAHAERVAQLIARRHVRAVDPDRPEMARVEHEPIERAAEAAAIPHAAVVQLERIAVDAVLLERAREELGPAGIVVVGRELRRDERARPAREPRQLRRRRDRPRGRRRG